MIKLNCGQSVAAFTRSSGLPYSGVLLVPTLLSGEGDRPLWMQMLKKPAGPFGYMPSATLKKSSAAAENQ